jgi:hypothetical protein
VAAHWRFLGNFMKLNLLLAATVALCAIGAGAAQAATVTVTPGGAWTNPVGENGGGGSSAITTTAARSGNGSVEMFGDRTRFVLGDLYSPASNLGLLSNYTDLAFDFMLATDSTSNLGPDYTPALRITYWDNGVQDELIWEGAYNGLYGTLDNGVWYSTSSSSTFYKKSLHNENNEHTLADWLGTVGKDAYVSAIYFGVGSSVGGGYHTFADNVVAGGTTYNFETAAVPEPATWGLMILGFGVAGGAIRSQRRRQAAV